jgi:hypothetical protein
VYNQLRTALIQAFKDLNFCTLQFGMGSVTTVIMNAEAVLQASKDLDLEPSINKIKYKGE